MDQVFNYSIDRFPFHNIVQHIFGCDNLMFIHELAQGPYHSEEPGKDQQTEFHKKFYKAIHENDAFISLYKDFVHDTLRYLPLSCSSDSILYQRIPTFRVHLPGSKAVGGKSHKDADYHHPLGEINFLVPLTSMIGSNGIFYETEPGLKDFQIKELNPGQIWCFNGNQCEHGNVVNNMGWTRVSFDFRIISRSDFNKADLKKSIAYGLKFIEGEYYASL